MSKNQSEGGLSTNQSEAQNFRRQRDDIITANSNYQKEIQDRFQGVQRKTGKSL